MALEHQYAIPYKTVGSEQLTLDIHFSDTSGRGAVLLWLHGGGWKKGDSRLGEEKILWPLAEQGITVVSVNYRLSHQAKHPEQLFDVFDAIAWLEQGNHGYHFNINSLFVGGGSAGGHLSSLVGVNPGLFHLRYPDSRIEPRGIISLYPVVNPLIYDGQRLAAGEPSPGTFAYSVFSTENGVERFGTELLGDNPVLDPSPFLESYQSLSSQKIPPFLVLHGYNDSDVSVEHSLVLNETLRNQGVDTTLLLFGDADHGSVRFHQRTGLATTIAFIKEHS